MGFPITWNADYIDSQYKLWKSDPGRVSHEWRLFFEGFDLAATPEYEGVGGVCDKAQVLRQSRVEELVYRYRDIGHLLACLDPLTSCPTEHPLLSLQAFGLSEEDLDRTFYTPHIPGMQEASLRDIIKLLKETYCRTIGVEFMHMQDPHERKWLIERMEPVRNRPALEDDAGLRILNKLYQAGLFEHFLHTKYIGQKRFSLEGAEAVIPMLDFLCRRAANLGCREMVIGMAHRGRLNVQVNILERPYESVFCEFEENYDPESLVGAGDVKYHTGYLGDIKTSDYKNLRVLMATNPSHLEAVDPVIEGITRARQERYGNDAHRSVLPVLIHGDASFAGQGVVFETLNLSQLEGYHTGGTVHIVINNQIGFTTVPEDARSTRYSTDVAKMLMVPIFHVHGEDPEAVVHVVELACDYRFTFGKDVVIDLVCYRRYGHNEGDEPYYTQPQMYERIRNRRPVFDLYAEEMVRRGVTTEGALEEIKGGITQCLESAYGKARESTCPPPDTRYYEDWQGIGEDYSHSPVETGVHKETLLSLARKLNDFPKSLAVHPRLRRILNRRVEAVESGEGIDWATAEALAFASLLLEGTPIRISGQDTRRGTFSQRHSVLVDTATGEHFTPLNALGGNQAPFYVYDSMLSENAVLGFEYGYSLVSPHSLVIWEAQFGDFANNAQVIIDQFLSSAQSKWSRLSGLVLLLPHGLEGQGPEHSSARLERFLQLCAEDNIQVCYPTTPAQYFHLLRRQMKRSFRKPLVVMAPKSLLRLPRAVSSLFDMTSGHFQEVLGDPEYNESPKRLLLCSGKIFYDLLNRREAGKPSQCAIVRLEQFYPFPEEQLKRVLSAYSTAEEFFWVQEEPENMGGWSFVLPRLQALTGRRINYIGRPPAASPATGFRKVHIERQEAIIAEAIGGVKL